MAAVVGGAAGVAAIAGGVATVAGSVISGNAASKRAAQAAARQGDQQAAAMLQMREAVERLESEGVPSIEAQKIVLQRPESVGLQDIHEIAMSEYENIEEDPRLQAGQFDTLAKFQEIAESGATPAEQAQARMDYMQVAAEDTARRKGILNNMAQRGVSGSGQELAAQLQGAQASANTRAMMQAQQMKDREARKMAALSQAGQLAGQIRGQEFGQAAQAASAKDRIKQFDLTNRMNIEAANLAKQQHYADEATRMANIEETTNKGLLQQDYQNRMQKAQGIAAAKTNQAQQSTQAGNAALAAGQAAAQGEIAKGAAITGAIGNMAGAAMQHYGKAEPTPADISKINTAEDGGILYADGGVAPMMLPQDSGQPHPMSPPIQPPNTSGGFEDGGIPEYAGGGVELPDMGDDDRIIPGDDFEGDRVDAKINSGEMVINVEQQQRLMDLLKGLSDLKDLGDENIIEPAPVSDNPPAFPPSGGPDLPPLPPEGIPMPQDQMPMSPEGMADGGITRGGIRSQLEAAQNKMIKSEDQLKEAQKRTKAKINALKTLME